MIRLAWGNLIRRPVRTGLTVLGLSVAIGLLVCLSAFGNGYRHALRTELDRMGVQLMVVPLGCPYDAAARVLKGKTLETSLPESALQTVRRDPAVVVAAPMLLAAVPRLRENRTDLWVGIDEAAMKLKPWWRVKSGARWFADGESVILGAEAAAVELRGPGDKFYSPEKGRSFRVSGVLEPSGTSDDSLFFVPLRTAQAMFGQGGRLTAVAIRLRDPALLQGAAERLQQIPGAQVVTLTEMMGTFLNLVGAVRALLLAIATIAVTVGSLSVLNTLLAAVVERTGELSLMRALGASRTQILRLLTIESILLAVSGSAGGLLLASAGGRGFEVLVKPFVPLAPADSLLSLDAAVIGQSVAVSLAIGLLAALLPAWRASRLPPAEAARKA